MSKMDFRNKKGYTTLGPDFSKFRHLLVGTKPMNDSRVRNFRSSLLTFGILLYVARTIRCKQNYSQFNR
jgi:hypothetical protein